MSDLPDRLPKTGGLAGQFEVTAAALVTAGMLLRLIGRRRQTMDK